MQMSDNPCIMSLLFADYGASETPIVPQAYSYMVLLIHLQNSLLSGHV